MSHIFHSYTSFSIILTLEKAILSFVTFKLVYRILNLPPSIHLWFGLAWRDLNSKRYKFSFELVGLTADELGETGNYWERELSCLLCCLSWQRLGQDLLKTVFVKFGLSYSANLHSLRPLNASFTRRVEETTLNLLKREENKILAENVETQA